jgi:hypothetical protein
MPELRKSIPEALFLPKLEAGMERRKDLQEVRLRNEPFRASDLRRNSRRLGAVMVVEVARPWAARRNPPIQKGQ